jgi:hypothetical protein
MIGIGIAVVAVDLMFFMEGLRLGLMPLGETLGAVLPRNAALPVLAVLVLGVFHYAADDYYGRSNYAGEARAVASTATNAADGDGLAETLEFSLADFKRFLEYGRVEDEHRVRYDGGTKTLENGRIVLRDSVIVLEKLPERPARQAPISALRKYSNSTTAPRPPGCATTASAASCALA